MASASTHCSPGTIHTPFVDRYLAESYDDPVAGLETLKKRQLTGDLGRPEDVASRRAVPRLRRVAVRARLGACSSMAACAAPSDRTRCLVSHRMRDGRVAQFTTD